MLFSVLPCSCSLVTWSIIESGRFVEGFNDIFDCTPWVKKVLYTMSQKSTPPSFCFLTCILSQGSVATRFRCGGIVSDFFIANFQEIVSVKEFWKSVNIWWNYDKNAVVYFFDSPCITVFENGLVLLRLLCLVVIISLSDPVTHCVWCSWGKLRLCWSDIVKPVYNITLNGEVVHLIRVLLTLNQNVVQYISECFSCT